MPKIRPPADIVHRKYFIYSITYLLTLYASYGTANNAVCITSLAETVWHLLSDEDGGALASGPQGVHGQFACTPWRQDEISRAHVSRRTSDRPANYIRRHTWLSDARLSL